MRKETAEQKLLKLIENSDKQKSAGGQSPPPGTPLVGSNISAGQDVARRTLEEVRGIGLPVPPSLTPAIKVAEKFFHQMAGLILPHMGFGIKELNRILLTAVICLFLFWVMIVMWGMQNLQKKIDYRVNNRSAMKSNETPDPIAQAKDVSVYLEPVMSRNIFQPFEKKAGDEVVVSPGSRKIAVKIEKFRLVGISWLDSAESASVMIEDTESGITYFLKQGEKIKDVSVKAIFADQVILTFEGEERAMKL